MVNVDEEEDKYRLETHLTMIFFPVWSWTGLSNGLKKMKDFEPNWLWNDKVVNQYYFVRTREMICTWMYNIKEKKIWGGFMYVVLGFVCVFLHNFDIVVCVSVTVVFILFARRHVFFD